jgi:hypothetical protein
MTSIKNAKRSRAWPGEDHVEQELAYWIWRTSDQFEFDLLIDPDRITSPIDLLLMDPWPREMRNKLIQDKKKIKSQVKMSQKMP